MLKSAPSRSLFGRDPQARRASVPVGRQVPAWLREPLLHFVVLGGVLFAVDHFVAARNDDPRTIVVGAEVDDEARRVFEASRNRLPDANELAALRRVWLDNEVLYREGIALQVDKGDTAIRERVIFKALSVIDASVKLPPIDDVVLRKWFDDHHAKYDEPARFDFHEAVLAGSPAEGDVRAFAEALNGGTPGDAGAGLRVFKGRPRASLVDGYGAAFVAALEGAQPQRWYAFATRSGWRAVRLESRTPARPARFETLRGVVLQDWTDATLSGQRSAAVRALATHYTVRDESAKR